jgi:hypothetical protein
MPPAAARAWLAGSLALSTPQTRTGYVSHAPERALTGAPETDLRIRINSWSPRRCRFGGRVRSVDEDGCSAPMSLSGGGLEFDDELGGHPATVFHVDALGFSPLANFGGVQAGRRSPASVPGWPASSAAGPPRSAHIARKGVPQRLGVLGAQVDLILGTVQSETDGSFGFSAIKVIDEQGLDLLGHGRSIPLTDLWRTSVDNPTPGPRTAAPRHSAGNGPRQRASYQARGHATTYRDIRYRALYWNRHFFRYM